jgi:glycosyltransferase involved in cell wall biosynthesis
MKILQLTKKFPFPLMDGESIAVYYLSRALRDLECTIDLLSMNTVKHYFDLDKIPDSYDHYRKIHTIEVDNRVRIIPAFLNLFSRKSYHISRFESTAFKRKLIHLLQQENYDTILLETLYLTPYVSTLRKYSKAKIIMRSHNLEYEIWERMLKNMKFNLAKLYLIYLVRKLKRYELKHLNDYDYLVTVTQRDLSNFVKLGFAKKGMVIPIGIDTDDYHPHAIENETPMRISFIGSLDWMPNMEGISWFLNQVWDMYAQKLEGIELHVAGRNTPDSFRKDIRKHMLIHGEVADANEFISSCPVMIVPLFSGSGMRVKILEAMALERVVVTTSLGLEGIQAKHKEQVLIANTANDFVEQLSYCRDNPEAVRNMGIKARKLIQKKYDNQVNASRLQEALKKLNKDLL